MSVIDCRQLAKCYQLGANQVSLREALPGLVGRLLGRRRPDPGVFWALQDVSFQVQAGEILGIIGPNGAGKSTILKLLSRVTRPTSGSVETRGRLAALIELGAGFHPDLTGRENVFLNGAILGLRRDEIRRRFDAIVDFAGIEPFIDTPIKRYSSGMYVRLAFAIAAHVEADLLLVDEVLSVGDTAFQAKCLEKMHKLHAAGTTIVLISHDLWTILRFCRRALLLSGGRLIADGTPEMVVERYQEQIRAASEPPHPLAQVGAPSTEAQIVQVDLLDDRGVPARELTFNTRLTVRAHYRAPQPIVAPLLLLRICRSDGLVCCALNNRDAVPMTIAEGEGLLQARVGPLPLVPDFYRVDLLVLDRDLPLIYAGGSSEVFRITGVIANARDAGVFAPEIKWMGVVARGAEVGENWTPVWERHS
jgi:lipopolysaccharide transport system ATP-binding protein